MRVAFLLLASSGCNWVYGITDTRPLDAAIPIDAQFFDAPPDAPPACPQAMGEPMFQSGYQQVPIGECYSYSPSNAGFAIADCRGMLVTGPVDGELDEILDLQPAPTPPARFSAPRLSADGAYLMVTHGGTLKFETFAREETGRWTKLPFTLDAASYRHLSTPSDGPDRRLLQTDFNGSVYSMVEHTLGPNGWSMVDSYPLSAIGMGFVSEMTLSADGLRLTMAGQVPQGSNAIFTASRATLAERFGMPVQLTTVPRNASYPYMTDNCSRIYFSGLQAVFFQKQL